jgi:hypothetical protein
VGGATTADDTVWAYGLRNPWRCSFDRDTGDLWIGDVGQNAVEEVNFQAAGTGAGRNYGWRCTEGTSNTGLTGCTFGSPTLTAPIHVYNHVSGTNGGYCLTGATSTAAAASRTCRERTSSLTTRAATFGRSATTPRRTPRPSSRTATRRWAPPSRTRS